jgi:hypothetical protein
MLRGVLSEDETLDFLLARGFRPLEDSGLYTVQKPTRRGRRTCYRDGSRQQQCDIWTVQKPLVWVVEARCVSRLQCNTVMLPNGSSVRVRPGGDYVNITAGRPATYDILREGSVESQEITDGGVFHAHRKNLLVAEDLDAYKIFHTGN